MLSRSGCRPCQVQIARELGTNPKRLGILTKHAWHLEAARYLGFRPTPSVDRLLLTAERVLRAVPAIKHEVHVNVELAPAVSLRQYQGWENFRANGLPLGTKG